MISKSNHLVFNPWHFWLHAAAWLFFCFFHEKTHPEIRTIVQFDAMLLFLFWLNAKFIFSTLWKYELLADCLRRLCCCFSFLLSVLAAPFINTVWTPQWIMHVWWGIGCFPRQSTKQVSRWRDESYPSKTKLKLNDQLRLVARVCSHSADRPFARISFPCLSCFFRKHQKAAADFSHLD